MKAIKAGFVIAAMGTSSAGAAISSGWFDYAVGQLGKEGRAALQLIPEEGLILSRIRTDYVAFSFGETRLSEEEQKSEPIDVTDLETVIEFETCDPTNELLSGKIYKARFRHNPSDVATTMEEIIDINKFLVRVAGETRLTRETDEGSYVSVHKTRLQTVEDVFVEFRMSKGTHFIELEAIAPNVCEE